MLFIILSPVMMLKPVEASILLDVRMLYYIAFVKTP